MRSRKHLLFGLAVFVLQLGRASPAQTRPIDTANSHLHVHVFKSGLFSAFADNHDIDAPIVEGAIDENGSRVNFMVDSRAMKVLDPQLSSDKRREVQERMLGPDVLDSMRFPQIAFQSTNVHSGGQDQFRVTGRLSLHGITRQVTATVKKNGEHYVGTCALKQTDFGITPVSIAGGTVKVKDQVKIEFDIQTKQ